MPIIDIYQINITSELVMIAVLIFLLVSCLLQRKQLVTAKPLRLLITVNLLLLLCQVAEWVLMIKSGNQSGGSIPAFRNWKVLTYTLDYVFGYASSVSFYYYGSEHIRELYLEKELPYPDSRYNGLKFLIAWGIGAAMLFGICLRQKWFYYLQPDGSEMFNWYGYFALYLMAAVATVFVVVKLIRHRKILGTANFVLLLLYKLTPTGLLIADLLHGTCLTYLMRAFYTFVLYVHMDMRRDKDLAERKVQLAERERELLELRTKIMLSQMQPHFLYNTFTTISALCYLENAEEARQVVDKFAAYFRENMDSMGKDKLIPFEKELEHIKTYLWIEKVRFEEDLTVEYKIGPRDFMLPSLSLQPLVENAVKHGICRKQQGGTITIETKETADEFLVIITDDGVGFDPDRMPDDGKSHVGIENIIQRLELICHGRLELRSTPNAGTSAAVHLPKERELS